MRSSNKKSILAPFPIREMVGLGSMALPNSSIMLPNESVYARIWSDKLLSSCRRLVCLSGNEQ